MKNTIVDILMGHASELRGKPVFAFLDSDEREVERFTFDELDARARGLASQLRERGRPGDRVVLLYSSGLEFIAAFFACLYAGMIAVPLSTPRRTQSFDKVLRVLHDCKASIALTDSSTLQHVGARIDELTQRAQLQLLATDHLQTAALAAQSDPWKRPEISGESLAFIQYTSGSTGQPKGVCVRHSNVIENSLMINRAFGHDSHTVMASWLPLFHDMGLIGSVMQPVFNGFLSALVAPPTFIQRPMRWLRLISRYKATTAGGPNFGYDLCVQKFLPSELDAVDLSSWEVAFNGAEPVRPSTLSEFARLYEPYGFRSRMGHPCYGMAEATLIVSGGGIFEEPRTLNVDAERLEQGIATRAATPSDKQRELVGCGREIPGEVIRIVEPERLTICRDGQVGEVWIKGGHIAAGYWDKPAINEAVFNAYTADTREGPFLRSGDLGFILDGELYISGRAKDLIILNGRNLYPQDIELAVEQSHGAFQPGGAAAFTTAIDGKERLVVVQECRRTGRHVDPAEATAAARTVLAREFEASLFELVLISQATLPKTSSGKVQRHRCRELYRAGELGPKKRTQASPPNPGKGELSV